MQYALIEITFDLNKIQVKLGIKSNVLNFTVLGNCDDNAKVAGSSPALAISVGKRNIFNQAPESA